MSNINNVLRVREPLHYTEAPRNEGWVQAMQEELNALEENDTWDLTSLPKSNVAIDSKWVYKIKFKPDGETQRLKACGKRRQAKRRKILQTHILICGKIYLCEN